MVRHTEAVMCTFCEPKDTLKDWQVALLTALGMVWMLMTDAYHRVLEEVGLWP